MMKDVNGISSCDDPLVYQYIITVSPLYSTGVVTHLFTYTFDIFIRCNNTRHITAFDELSISVTIVSITSIPTLYHIQIKLSTVFNFSSIHRAKW